MAETTDSFFLRPQALLSADRVNAFEAINLVVYAKLPLKSKLSGSDLIAGWVRIDSAGRYTTRAPSEYDSASPELHQAIATLSYPIGPSHYEPLLAKMLEAGHRELPFFIHEHFMLVDRHKRARIFMQLHGELRDAVARGHVIVQLTDSQRADMLSGDSWMTRATFQAYLDEQGVTPWWSNSMNLHSHQRLERMAISDALKLLEGDVETTYDFDQLPSYLCAQMLLKQAPRPRDNARSPSLAEVATLAAAGAPTLELEDFQFVPPLLTPVVAEQATPPDGTTQRKPAEVRFVQQPNTEQKRDSADSRHLVAAPTTDLLGYNETEQALPQAEPTTVHEFAHESDLLRDPAGAKSDRVSILAGALSASRAEVNDAHEAAPSFNPHGLGDDSDALEGAGANSIPHATGEYRGQEEHAPHVERPEPDAFDLAFVAPRIFKREPRSAPAEPEHAQDKPPIDLTLETAYDDDMMTKREVSVFLGLSIGTIDNYRKRPDFPKERVYGPTTIRWKRSEIRQWRDRNPAS